MREVLPALPGESTSVALHPVLGFPLADRQGTAGETPQRVQRYGGDPEHVLMGAGWEPWGCSAGEEKAEGGSDQR